MREDLSATTLPHGDELLPLPMAKEAEQGMVLRVSDAKMSPLPVVEVGETGRDMLQKMMGQRLGDILYPSRPPLLWWPPRSVIWEAVICMKRQPRNCREPPLISANPQSPKSLPGTIGGLKEGHVYLIGTVEGKFALVRLMKMEPNGAQVQYVFQPDATLKFAIPKGDVAPLHPAVAASEPANMIHMGMDPHGPSTQPIGSLALSPRPTATLEPVPKHEVILEPVLHTWMVQRQGLVAKRIETVKAPGAERMRK